MKEKPLKIILFISLALSCAFEINAQQDSVKTIVLNSVYVTEKKPSFKTTSREVIALTNSEMKERGAQTLSDAIATLPGVSQITTGAISKPVVRGLYGDRIQINVAGLKLEDQQWEDEHGLGLSDVGIDRVELIKGPASLMFGSGAMGGVVNIIEENLPEAGTKKQNLNFKLFSNTYGAGIDYGFKKSGKNTLLMRTGIESHADYSDGAGNRVPNTRFALYNINLGYIVQRERFKSENRFLASFNEFGFIADSADLNEGEVESRLSREFEEAHHTVLFFLLSSVNTLRLNEKTELNITMGIQSNLRQEQERADEVDLSLLLNTFSLNTSVRNQLNHQWTISNGISGMIQTNTNYAERIIVPDATIAEGSVFSYVNHRHQAGIMNGNFEAGLRFDHRQLNTLMTGSENSIITTQQPFNRGFDNLNGSLGESMNFKNLLLKFNLSSGFRSGNLAELAANGLHEGTTNWYTGNPHMKVEQCLNADISASWQYKWINIRGSVFRNSFYNFIYLRPTNDEMFGYKIYRYDQDNAILKGFEAGASLENKDHFSLSFDYSYLDAKRSDNSWLPFTPANRFIFESKYFFPALEPKYQNAFLSLGANYTMKQDHTDAFELTTPAYLLINAGAGVTFKSLRFILTCRNMTNTKYYDHLSRLKYFGQYDTGRNIVLNIGWQF
jgi:iron complex outermembrane receptor protein